MTEDQDRRLWEFTLHEDRLFNERQGLFLIAESMLAVAYATALSGGKASVALTIAIAGLPLSVMWLYVSARHAILVESIQLRARNTFPDYREISTERKERLRKFPVRSRYVVTYGVPLLIGVLWAALLVLRF